MANTETDRLQLVEIVPVRGILGIFKRTISATDGFSIEVFRGERHIGSILSKDLALASDVIKLDVRPNDILYRINLGPKLLTLNGTFGTADRFEPSYKVVLEVGVVNPKQFAMRYRQQDDPVHISQIALEGELQRYASLRLHDQLKSDELSYRAEHALNTGHNKNIGLGVVHVHDVVIFSDPHKQEKRYSIKDYQHTSVITQKDIDKIPREGEQDHLRRIDEQLLEKQLFQKVLDRRAKGSTETLIDQIRDQIAAGYSLEEIYAESPELQNVFEVAKRSVNVLAMLEQIKEDLTETFPSADEQGALEQEINQEEQTQRAAMGKYNIQITGNVQGSTIGDHAQVTMNFGEPPDHHGKQKSVDEVRQPQLRYLHARLPERVKAADKIPLQARVALLPAPNRSTPLRAFSIPPEGADLKLVLDCPGLLLHSASIATVHVTPTADSDWVLFELEALHDGVYTLEISAFNEGAFLGTLSLQLTVDSLAMRTHSVDHFTLLPLRSPHEGEVTLVIRYDPLSAVYRYQFRGTTFGETDELRSGPLRRRQEEAVADLTALLNEQARDLTEYSAEETRRWLQGKGVELWKELIPKELENLFWQQRENIKWMTILSAGDPMPWEMMYPTNDAGDDAGFLAEQFPIVRWIFGSAPTTQLHCSQPFFVVPDDAPLTAEDELAALRRILGEGQNINDLTPLLKVLDNAEFDTLHFACHNIFRADSPTSSSIQLGSKRFVPTFLNKYNRHFHSPLVFMNACRSDGMAVNYTWLAGWANSFLAAGAGAFIGSLWEVRDSSASLFAETFYQALHSGISLGDAMKQARTAIQNEPGDPTWLAYTLYGNPTAILLKEAPEVS